MLFKSAMLMKNTEFTEVSEYNKYNK